MYVYENSIMEPTKNCSKAEGEERRVVQEKSNG
jgi:hypothetical protein